MSYPPSYLWYQRGAECDGKGEPSCHPSRFSRAAASPTKQSLPTPKYIHQGKQMEKKKNLQNTYKSFFTPGSSPVAPCWRASKASRESVSNFQVIQRWGKTNIHSRASFSQQASLPCMVLYSTVVTPRCVRGSELVLVLNLVRQCATDVHHSSYYSWMNRSVSPPRYIDLHSAAHYINCQSLHWHRPLYIFNPLPSQPNNYPDLIPTGTVLTDHHGYWAIINKP